MKHTDKPRKPKKSIYLHVSQRVAFFQFFAVQRPILIDGVILDCRHSQTAGSYAMISCPVKRAMLFLIDLNLLATFSSLVETFEVQRSPIAFFDLQNLIGDGRVKTPRSCGESEVAG
jgi:hypothetical protein